MSYPLELVIGGCQLSVMGTKSQIWCPVKQQEVLNVDPFLQSTNFYLKANEQLPQFLLYVYRNCSIVTSQKAKILKQNHNLT